MKELTSDIRIYRLQMSDSKDGPALKVLKYFTAVVKPLPDNQT